MKQAIGKNKGVSDATVESFRPDDCDTVKFQRAGVTHDEPAIIFKHNVPLDSTYHDTSTTTAATTFKVKNLNIVKPLPRAHSEPVINEMLLFITTKKYT